MTRQKEHFFGLLLSLALTLALTVYGLCSGKPAGGGKTGAAEAEAAGTTETAEPAETGEAAETAEPADSAEPAHTNALRLGSTSFFVHIPDGFRLVSPTEEGRANGQVGFYYSDATTMDFFVYSYSKEDWPDSLAGFVTQDGEAYHAVEIVTDAEINGIPVGYYRSIEEVDGVSYDVITYAMEDEDYYVELDLWADSDEAKAEALAIINSLEIAEPADYVQTKVLQLGSSSLSVLIPDSFQAEEITEADLAADRVGSYFSYDTSMDFYVYYFSKEGYPDNLAEFVAGEAAEYDAFEVVTDAEINGVPVAYYRSIDEYDGISELVITYAIEDGDYYVEVDFWLESEDYDAEALAIINSLSRS